MFWKRTNIVNVRMVITEEKILSNIDKVHKLINPSSKKQIVQFEEDSYFKDLIESIKTYLVEYPKKKNFPKEVYDAAYNLVEFATTQFEANTKQIEELIRQREKNITLANELKDVLDKVVKKEKTWKDDVKNASESFQGDIIDTLGIIGRAKSKKSQNYLDAVKLINARITNLEANLHIEIDMERIEDRSKALSYIGIEIADALKVIPTPVEKKEKVEQTVLSKEEKKKDKKKKSETKNSIIATEEINIEDKKENAVAIENNKKKKQTVSVAEEVEQNIQETEEILPQKPQKVSLWQKLKNTRLVKTISFIMKIRIVIEFPALPEGKEE